MVELAFTCEDVTLDESTALDFGVVQAGSESAVKIVTVSNTGDSDAQQCVIEPVEATIENGFSIDLQQGTAQETYLAQSFAEAADSTEWYEYAVIGEGNDYENKTGGTIDNTNGQDTFATKWAPPASGKAGQKVWGNVFTCVYV